MFIEICSTWEVWRALKKLELLSTTSRATLTHLSCSPNFLRASYLDERTLTYEPIIKYLFIIFRMLLEPCQRESRSILCKFPFRNQFGSYVIVFVNTFYHKTGEKSFYRRKRLVFSRTAAQTSPCFDLSYKLFQKRMS